MLDLLSSDGNHVAEVITTVPSDSREAEKSLKPLTDLALPQRVWFIVPCALLGEDSKKVRNVIKAEILRRRENEKYKKRRPSQRIQPLTSGKEPFPILSLSPPDSRFQALCVRICQHPANQPHHIKWTIVHELTSIDPWQLIRQALRQVEAHQPGGISAVAKKLSGHPNKRLVMYLFGP